MFRVITVSREHGSGGGIVAEILAKHLGWKLLDASVVDEVARRAKVPPNAAARWDEGVDPWFYGLVKALWHAYASTATTPESEPFDSETMAKMTAEIFREAAQAGECVIVGRGSQCVLRRRKDVFHVSVFAPREEKVQRLRGRLAPGTDVERALEETDRKRSAYIKRFFGEDWKDRRLYHLTISSTLGLETVAATIVCAAGVPRAHS